jgi:hypothetical protein
MSMAADLQRQLRLVRRPKPDRRKITFSDIAASNGERQENGRIYDILFV